MNSMLNDATYILCEGTNDSFVKVQAILEDSSSPVSKNYKEKLFKSVIDKSHVDFGSIPKSKGDISKYNGYESMMESLTVLLKIANDERSTELKEYTEIVMAAVENIKSNRSLFVKAFAKKIDIIEIDYNTFVLTCVEATTALMSTYIDYIKTPSSPNFVLSIKNTKYRADELYFEQLKKFNKINESGNYAKYAATVINKGQENMFLDPVTIVGVAFVSVIAFSVIPVTRELIYLYNESKRKLSETFALQAYFLDMNKASIEYNTAIKPEDKKKILDKQEKLRKKFLLLSEKLRINNLKAEENAKRKLDNDNSGMTVGDINNDISDSDMVIL
jgi:hypothetical protein